MTPYVICDGEKIYIDDNDLNKIITINVVNPAQSIEFSETNTTLSPTEEKEVTVSILSNKKNERVIIRIEGTDIVGGTGYIYVDNDHYLISNTNALLASYNTLLQYRLKYESHQELEKTAGAILYYHTYTFAVSMNVDEYAKQTLDSG